MANLLTETSSQSATHAILTLSTRTRTRTRTRLPPSNVAKHPSMVEEYLRGQRSTINDPYKDLLYIIVCMIHDCSKLLEMLLHGPQQLISNNALPTQTRNPQRQRS